MEGGGLVKRDLELGTMRRWWLELLRLLGFGIDNEGGGRWWELG